MDPPEVHIAMKHINVDTGHLHNYSSHSVEVPNDILSHKMTWKIRTLSVGHNAYYALLIVLRKKLFIIQAIITATTLKAIYQLKVYFVKI